MRVLFCGLGSIGQRHLRNLLKISTQPLDITAYRTLGRQITLRDDLTVEEGVKLEDKYPIGVYDSLDEALKNKPDIVFITNPMSRHYETLKAVIDSTDADVFIEKPLAVSPDGLAQLAEKAKEKKITVFTGYQNRFHPCIKKAKELIDAGTIGNIAAANIEIGEYMPATRKYEDYRESCAVKKELGGGIILSQIHEIDYAYYFFGKPEKVFAVGGKLSDMEIDVEDTASILMSCRRSDGAVFPVHAHLDFIQSPATRKCKIVGSHGKIEFDLLSAHLICSDGTGKTIIEEKNEGFARNDMFIQELKTFFAIRNGEMEPILDIEEAMHSLEIALAAKKAIEREA